MKQFPDSISVISAMQSVTGDGVNRQVATQFANAHLFTEQQRDETA